MRTAIPDRRPVPTIDAARRAFASGDIASAELICAQILARQPNAWAAWALLAETALQRGRADAAIVSAERAAALASNNPIPLILKAKCLFVSGKARDALDVAEKAEAIVGTAPEALDALGGLFGMLGLYDRARPCSSAPSRSAPACRNISSTSRRPNA